MPPPSTDILLLLLLSSLTITTSTNTNLPTLLLPLPQNATNPWYPFAEPGPSLSFPNTTTSLLPSPVPFPPSSPNHTTPSTPNAPSAKYSCSAPRYGRNLNLESCLNAWRRMDDAPVPKTYGQRDAADPGSTDWDANLPLRILSNDGRCAIDISHSTRAPSDTIAPSFLKSHARALISICLQGSSPPIGGIAYNIGDNGHLALRVTKYDPVNVECSGEAGTGPPWFDCRDAIDAMPVSGVEEWFGKEGGVELPWRWQRGARGIGSGGCVVTINTVGGPDVSDFYKLWAAANAVDTLCVTKGKAGFALRNGKNGNLIVGLENVDVVAGYLNSSRGEMDAVE